MVALTLFTLLAACHAWVHPPCASRRPPTRSAVARRGADGEPFEEISWRRYGRVVDLPWDAPVRLGLMLQPPADVVVLVTLADGTETAPTMRVRGAALGDAGFPVGRDDAASERRVCPFTSSWRGDWRALLAFEDDDAARQVAEVISSMEGWPLRAVKLATPEAMEFVRANEELVLAVVAPAADELDDDDAPAGGG